MLLRYRRYFLAYCAMGLLVAIPWRHPAAALADHLQLPALVGGPLVRPRYMTDMTPYLCYLLIPAVDTLRTASATPVPEDVDLRPDRPWDFRDPAFLR